MDAREKSAEEFRPMLARCNDIETLAPLRWISLGWNDFKRAPKHSLVYGFSVVLISYFIFSLAWLYNSITLALALLSSFVFVAPILCIGLYSIARQIKHNKPIDLRKSFRHGMRPYGDLLIFVIVMMVISLLWARAASMIHIFVPVSPDAKLSDLLIFLGIGSAVGSIFAAIIFSASVFSLPMIMDKKTDMITSCISSINAVLRNKPAMLLWSMIVVFFTGVGIMSGFLGFLVIMPLLGYATWHGYRESIDASAWEDRINEFSANPKGPEA